MAKINNKILVKLQNYCGVVLLLLLPSICIAVAATNNSTSDVKSPRCNGTCGKLKVPYPFGIDDKDCAKDKEFLLTCNRSFSPPKLILGENIEVLDISVENGTMSVSIDSAYKCYNESSLTASFDQNITLGNKNPYTFSSSENKLIGLGCDTLAFMNDADGKFGSGCISLCSDKVDLAAEGSCSGIGCCQTSLPKNLKSLEITLITSPNQSDVLTFNPCGFAFLVDQRTFNISNMRLDFRPETVENPSVLLDWMVGEEKC
ncbi:Wall-associated receptor kinase 2 [Morus notabilis]|uniref:Wall-associated receptor kinase 2 n=1 Tax=Morus notabilis TaxID=981085 RepID=W9S6U1_9ROSA|nr:Wall-associated receptor kinase 2 [Morus notabilis]